MKALVYQVRPAGYAACMALRGLWKGCVLSRLGGLRLQDVPAPKLPGDDWALVRTRLGGICGTDLSLVGQKQRPDSILQAFGSMPMVLGHENVGTIESVGPALDKSLVGRRVCVEPTLGCTARGIEPPCGPCRRGQFGACENFGAVGAGKYGLPAGTSIGYNARTGGSMGEFFVAHQSQVVPAPDGLSDEAAVLTDPLACSLHAVLRADLSQARKVLVQGGGVLGLGCVAALRAAGFGGTIDLAARHDFQAQLGRKLGATEIVLQRARRPLERFEEIAGRTGGSVHRVRMGNLMLSGGYDVVFDCVGSRQSVGESLKWTAARGQVVMVGTGDGGGADLTPLWFRELTVIGAYGRQIESFGGERLGTYELVHKLMLAGKLPTAGLLTHTFKIDDYRRAFATAMDKGRSGAVKVVFDFRTS